MTIRFTAFRTLTATALVVTLAFAPAAHAGNYAGISQTGVFNGAGIAQSGHSNTAGIGQVGVVNGAGIVQHGRNNNAGIGQAGVFNGAGISQYGARPAGMP